MLQMAKDTSVLNRVPFKQKLDFETYLKFNAAADVDLKQLEELREEQEEDADKEGEDYKGKQMGSSMVSGSGFEDSSYH